MGSGIPIMFTNDRLVYLQLHKTGCTHITALLEKHVGGKQDLKHARYTDNKDNRLYIGSVRNPWAWYVSLWAYGCKGLGVIFNAVTRTRWEHLTHPTATSGNTLKSYYWRLLRAARSGSRAEMWRSCYRDADDPVLFRRWLKLMYGTESRNDLTDGFPYSSLCQFAGLMTYRYCDLYFSWKVWREKRETVSSLAELAELDADACLVDCMIRTEFLETDLLKALDVAGYEIDTKTRQQINEATKSNTSSHRHYTDYYDDDSIEMVAQREAFIIGKHDYSFPKLSSLPGVPDR